MEIKVHLTTGQDHRMNVGQHHLLNKCRDHLQTAEDYPPTKGQPGHLLTKEEIQTLVIQNYIGERGGEVLSVETLNHHLHKFTQGAETTGENGHLNL